MDDKPKLTIVKSGNLSEGAQFWNDITAQHSLNEIELQILRTICTTMNLCEQFRRSLAEDGLVFYDRGGLPTKVNPCFHAEMSCNSYIVRMLDKLGLIRPLRRIRPPPDGGDSAA